jgi:hypothetical protein
VKHFDPILPQKCLNKAHPTVFLCFLAPFHLDAFIHEGKNYPKNPIQTVASQFLSNKNFLTRLTQKRLVRTPNVHWTSAPNWASNHKSIPMFHSSLFYPFDSLLILGLQFFGVNIFFLASPHSPARLATFWLGKKLGHHDEGCYGRNSLRLAVLGIEF